MFINDEHDQLLNAAVEAAQTSLSESFDRTTIVRPGWTQSGREIVSISVEPETLRLDVVSRTAASAGFALSIPTPRPALLVTSRLTPRVMAICRRRSDLACIDVDGNVFLRWAGGVIDIEGRPPSASRTITSKTTSGSLVTGRSGLQLVFILLSFPALISDSVRGLATAARISTGSVSQILRELEETGQIRQLRGRGERQLIDPPSLMDVFVDGYQRRLYDRLSLGTFVADSSRWWQTERSTVAHAGGQWGGESALWIENRLRPARGVVYVDELVPRLISELRLRKAPESTANAEFRKRFWRVESASSERTVPPLLTYADLLADADPRLLDAAPEQRKLAEAVFDD